MPNALAPFVAQLDTCGSFEKIDRAAILALPCVVQTFIRDTHVLRQGDSQDTLLVLIGGFATCQKLTDEGTRQLVSLNVAGDALNHSSLFLPSADHAVVALRNAEIAFIPREPVLNLLNTHPLIMRAFFRSALVDASMSREALLRMGRRDARARIAHFLCEYMARMEARGLASGRVFTFPLTQEQLGDALGLTAIHVNRTYNRLVDEGLIIQKARCFEIPDIDELRKAGEFNPRYLYL